MSLSEAPCVPSRSALPPMEATVSRTRFFSFSFLPAAATEMMPSPLRASFATFAQNVRISSREICSLSSAFSSPRMYLAESTRALPVGLAVSMSARGSLPSNSFVILSWFGSCVRSQLMASFKALEVILPEAVGSSALMRTGSALRAIVGAEVAPQMASSSVRMPSRSLPFSMTIW